MTCFEFGHLYFHLLPHVCILAHIRHFIHKFEDLDSHKIGRVHRYTLTVSGRKKGAS
jgi:hypothetical protein